MSGLWILPLAVGLAAATALAAVATMVDVEVDRLRRSLRSLRSATRGGRSTQ